MNFKKKFLILSILLGFPFLKIQAQSACPNGLTNDPYPGECGRYVDINKDKVCDLSQDAIFLKTKEKSIEEKKFPTSSATPTVLSEEMLPKEVVSPEITAMAVAEEENFSKIEADSLPKINKRTYNFFPLSIFLTLGYVFSLWLVRKKIVNLFWQRFFWNLVLLISFLISAILGIFLVIKINFGWVIFPTFNSLYWHVELGIVMAVVSLFHLFWHWSYFKCAIKKK